MEMKSLAVKGHLDNSIDKRVTRLQSHGTYKTNWKYIRPIRASFALRVLMKLAREMLCLCVGRFRGESAAVAT